jgi:2,4-dichlorophenol 6-monooxygenase
MKAMPETSDGKRIAIVGAGPTGLAAAILLRQHGVAASVFERRNGCCELPAAHVVNTRTNEILREMGVYDEMVKSAADPDKLRYITWSEAAGGTRLGKLPYQGNSEQLQERLNSSPVRTLNVGQNKVETILTKRFSAIGGQIRYGSEIVDARLEGAGAALIIESEGTRSLEHFDFVLACDGAVSSIRRSVGMEMEGPPSLARFASAYFEANLDPYFRGDTGPVHFIVGSDFRCGMIGFDLEKTWALMCVIPPGMGPESFTPKVMCALIRRAVGDPELEPKLIGVGSWNMSAQVAESFRKGAFFLVGDSAHRFPPTGGLGLNTGIQDAHNIAWKLALVLEGRAHASLLDTYEAERQPIARRNRDHSVNNSIKMAEVDEAIGSKAPGPVDPEIVKQPMTSRAVATTLDPARQERIQKAINNQRAHFDSIEMETGYRYGQRQDVRQVREWAQGSIIPHFWIEIERGRVSSLELPSRSTYTLFAFSDSTKWEKVIRELAAGGAPIDIYIRKEGSDGAALRAKSWPNRGAALVRPDGHIDWISQDPFAVQEFLGVLSRYISVPAELGISEATG